MSEAIKLEPCNIRLVWDEIRPGLEEIKRTWPLSSDWRPEDVYAACVAGEAVLYNTDDGFAVCTLETNQYTNESELHIWIAYSPDDKRGGMLRKYLPSFIDVARRFECSAVTTRSSHPALAAFPELEPVYVKYRHVT